MPATRTDIHRPAALVTEDYEFVAYGWFGGADSPGYSPLAHESAYLLDEGWSMGENGSAGQCYHCGAPLRYYAILKHLPTHTLIRVGETCLENRFDRASSEFHAMRQRAELDRQEQRIKPLREEWRCGHPEEASFLDAHEDSGFYGSLGRSLKRYGSLTERQLGALNRSIEREAAELLKDEAEAWTMHENGGPRELLSVPAFDGRTQITGTIEAIYWKRDDYYGSRHVMTIFDDRGFKLWGSVPKGLEDVEDGDRVTFTAIVEQSDRDETFGFFKRPTKAIYQSSEVAIA